MAKLFLLLKKFKKKCFASNVLGEHQIHFDLASGIVYKEPVPYIDQMPASLSHLALDCHCLA